AYLRPFGGGRMSIEGSGPGRSLRSPSAVLDCGNSGTTMRLLAGVLAAHELEAVLDGDESLRRRPMLRVAEPLNAMGASVGTAGGGTPPLIVRGSAQLHGLTWTPPVPSAQVKSAVLLAGLAADAATTVVEPLRTRDHTELLLRHCGIDVQVSDHGATVQPGAPQPFGVRIPGDPSAAAFLLGLAAALPGSRVRCTDVGLNPTRTGFVDALMAMGAEVSAEPDTTATEWEPRGALETHGAALHATVIAGELAVRCIDELPLLAVIGSQAEGVTEIHDAAELRAKESDRISVLATGLRALGVTCETFADGIAVHGPVRLRGARVDSGGDHRLAMAFAVAGALAADGTTVVSGAESVSVSFPGFFEALRGLAG
ncbi:MAG TPA: 3-phosphoshikimate 1-carboxyvinyltransferase, partial [Candidatus Dormibacteraeota bacterium]|nr:3-phosphoshikimate 1-carboxyvinyltransferase [Candidatus Dormibacteraeota bacterium]